jgi:flagellar L-ring protein precursor FlgH
MNRVLLLRFKPLVLAAIASAQAVNAPADLIWKEDASRSMFADKRAGMVGDLVTIIIQENATTSKDATTKTSKSSGIDMGISSFLYGPGASGLLTKGGQYPALKMDGKTSFDGSGAVGSSEKIVARVTVRVVDVLPNKNLMIEGSRQTSFSGETQDVVLRGVVRPEDIAPNNTVYSYNVSDVTIKFLSKGTVTDGQKKGWFTKTFDKVNPV